MTVEDYLNLITSQYRDKPKFEAMITSDVSPMTRVQDLLLLTLSTYYDLELATGSQLDVIGEWVGFSREVQIAVTGVLFSWDGSDPLVGWDYGIWADSENQAAVTSLPDDVYRTFIKAKIAANHWDGTTDGAYEVWDSVFTDVTIVIQDNLNMSYAIAFVGGIIDSLTVAVITGGYLPLKPEGVRISEYLFPANDGPLFGWDLETEFIEGWDTGSWPRVVEPT